MTKLTLLLALAVLLIVESSGQVRLVRPTYRLPPTSRPVIRTARDVGGSPPPRDEPVIYDDVKLDPNTRHARSLSTPGHGRIGSNDNKSGGSRSRDPGATHPGYNRRNARSVYLPDYVTTPPFVPKPWTPPGPVRRPQFPIYV